MVPAPLGAEIYGAPAVPTGTTEQARAVVRERLGRLADAVAKLGVRSSTTILDGTVPSALAEHFHEAGVDLIVMATHDGARLDDLLFGSVVRTLARRTHVPVLVVHPEASVPAFDSPVEIRRVLVPLDSSAFASQILPSVSALSVLLHPEITVLRVLDPAEVGKTSTEQLTNMAKHLRQHAAAVHTFAVVDGQPAAAIVDYAKHHDIDLIAMTTHAHRVLERVIVGSVADAVRRNSRVPMLLLRPRDDELR